MAGDDKTDVTVSRRAFLKSAAAAGAGLAIGPALLAAGAPTTQKDELRVALIGCGSQGRVLMQDCLRIGGLRFVALCDIWPYHLNYAAKFLANYKQPVQSYQDHAQMLAQEKDIDAVIVATPDWLHPEHTLASLKAGKHVYCESAMATTIDGARSMVKAARESGKLLQIGHQRRSNARYQTVRQYIHQHKAIGRPTSANGQWNRSKRQEVGWPRGSELDKATLERCGYDTMDRLRNWRWYRKFSAGGMADLGSHQLDVLSWLLGARPRAVCASGGRDYYSDGEWYDNLLALYEWDVPWDEERQVVRGAYQVLSTSSHGGYTESILGDEGSIIITDDPTKGGLRREVESRVAQWEDVLSRAAGGAITISAEPGPATEPVETPIRIGHTIPTAGRYYPLPVPEDFKPQSLYMPHLENFFQAIRDGGKTALSCPASEAFATTVAVLKANEAMEAGKRLEFKPADFEA